MTICLLVVYNLLLNQIDWLIWLKKLIDRLNLRNFITCIKWFGQNLFSVLNSAILLSSSASSQVSRKKKNLIVFALLVVTTVDLDSGHLSVNCQPPVVFSETLKATIWFCIMCRVCMHYVPFFL